MADVEASEVVVDTVEALVEEVEGTKVVTGVVAVEEEVEAMVLLLWCPRSLPLQTLSRTSQLLEEKEVLPSSSETYVSTPIGTGSC